MSYAKVLETQYGRDVMVFRVVLLAIEAKWLGQCFPGETVESLALSFGRDFGVTREEIPEMLGKIHKFVGEQTGATP